MQRKGETRYTIAYVYIPCRFDRLKQQLDKPERNQRTRCVQELDIYADAFPALA